MKAERLTVHRINRKTHTLPDNTRGVWLLLLGTDKAGRMNNTMHFYHNHSSPNASIFGGFTHYVVLPAHLF